MPSVLIVDDDASSREPLAKLIRRADFDTAEADCLAAARKALDTGTPDLVLLDLKLPDGDGLDLLDDIARVGPSEVVLITGYGSLETAVDALRAGVLDYLRKPIDIDRLNEILAEVRRGCEMHQEILRTKLLDDSSRFGHLVGASKPMLRVYDMIARVAPRETSVLLIGETGTGKELAARTIHDLSSRSRGPFLAVNCGAIPKELIGSELFGHERGAFTGAARSHRGCFERAEGGTLFLDEIAEMPTEQQTTLLRVLETQEITRVGGDRSIPVDARLVAATNRDPDEAVKEGLLRQDLRYRLSVFPLLLPPLRERGEDVPLLAQQFLDQSKDESDRECRFTPAALEKLIRHGWPGNVRELKNAIERASILADGAIDAEHLELDLSANHLSDEHAIVIQLGTSIAKAEKQLILATLDHFDGDKKQAAAVLGISLKTLYNRLNRYEGG